MPRNRAFDGLSQRRTSSGEKERPPLGSSGPNCRNLIWLSANLFSGALSRQSLLHPTLLARLQVVGVTLHFLNDFFRLNFALEPTQGVLQRFALLQSNFCQTHHPQASTISTILELTPFVRRFVAANYQITPSTSLNR